MDKTREIIAKGKRAEELLEEPLIVEAFEEIERAYIDGWKSSKARDAEGREQLFLAINILNNVREHLKAAIRDGKLEKATLAFNNPE